MKANGRYLLFIIYLAGTTLSDDDIFSEENKKKFLDHIFDLHNICRTIIRVQPLVRNHIMDKIAQGILMNKMIKKKERVPNLYGLNYHMKAYNHNTKLDYALADFIFSEWYFERFPYIDPVDQRIDKADASKQIVWEHTKEIGLAVERNNHNYAVIALYSPRYKTIIHGQFTLNISKPPKIDQGGPSIN